MSDCDGATHSGMPRRPRLVLAAIVVVLGCCNAAFFPIDFDRPNWMMAYAGAWLFQSILFGLWAAFGPGAALTRLPLTAVSLLLVVLATGVDELADGNLPQYI